MSKELYLTDEQYVKLLDKVENLIHKYDSFQVVDSTEIGNKYTTSNVGLCNDEEMTDEDNAMFPEYFIKHGRTGTKYRQKHQLCPFDTRINNILTETPVNMFNGCYYTCSLRSKRTNKEKMFSLVEITKELALSGKAKEITEKIDKI